MALCPPMPTPAFPHDHNPVQSKRLQADPLPQRLISHSPQNAPFDVSTIGRLPYRAPGSSSLSLTGTRKRFPRIRVTIPWRSALLNYTQALLVLRWPEDSFKKWWNRSRRNIVVYLSQFARHLAHFRRNFPRRSRWQESFLLQHHLNAELSALIADVGVRSPL